jgi:putative transposase
MAIESQYIDVKNRGNSVLKTTETKGIIKSATISKTPTGKYYVSILTENDHFKTLKPSDNQVDLDLGLKHFLIDSNGEKIENPKFLRKTLKKLRYEQRSLSRKKRFSKNWYKQKRKVSKLHEKIANQRLDFLHKLSKRLIENNDLIVVETLKVKNMLKNKKLSKSISDVSWSKFVELLTYKAKRYNRKLVKIDQWYPSSKTCHKCQYKVDKLSLNIRNWECP